MSDHPVDLPDLRAGVYRHWKGQPYQVLGYAHDANYEGRVCVAYIGLNTQEAHLGPRLAFRTYDGRIMPGHDAWTDLVCTVHGRQMEQCPTEPLAEVQREHEQAERESDGRLIVPRFEYLGSQWLGWR